MRPALDQGVFVRFATAVAPGYTSQRLSARQYVDDARFNVLGIAIAVGEGNPKFFWLDAKRSADDLAVGYSALRGQCNAGALLVAHDTHLEGMILAKYFGLRFGRAFDTAAYARALGLGASLPNVAQWLGYDRLAPPLFHENSLRNPALLADMATSCTTDVTLSREIFKHAIDNVFFPDVEFELISHTTQLNLRGVRVDGAQVDNVLQTLRRRRDAELEAFARGYVFDTSDIHKPKRVLRFVQEHFGVRLQSLDRKKDDFLAVLEQGGGLADFLLSRARLQTLSKAIGKVMAYAGIPDGRVHGVVRYYGAHTGRFSAGGREAEKLNLHGLGKGNELLELPELELERTVVVPEDGSEFCAADLSTIEARVVAWLAGEETLLERFRHPGDDIYSWFAGLVYPGVEIKKGGPNAHLRALGKTCVLGLGFGMGFVTFRRRLRAERIPCSDMDAQRAFTTFQTSFPRIKALRKELFAAFGAARNGLPTETPLWRMRREEHDGEGGPTVAVDLPTGRTLYYRSARVEMEWAEYGSRPGLWFAPRFGGKSKPAPERHRDKRRRFPDGIVRDRLTPQVIVENVVQAIARDVMAHQALELERRGLPVAWHSHDEIIVSCPACTCTGPCNGTCPWLQAGAELADVMDHVPPTLPLLADLPVGCEVNLNVKRTYSA